MVYMYHSFLICSSADGHLGCFHVLAIINSTVIRKRSKYLKNELILLVSECMYHIEKSIMDHVTNNSTGTNVTEK